MGWLFKKLLEQQMISLHPTDDSQCFGPCVTALQIHVVGLCYSVALWELLSARTDLEGWSCWVLLLSQNVRLEQHVFLDPISPLIVSHSCCSPALQLKVTKLENEKALYPKGGVIAKLYQNFGKTLAPMNWRHWCTLHTVNGLTSLTHWSKCAAASFLSLSSLSIVAVRIAEDKVSDLQ